jgi:hypothetical protein
MGNLKSKIFRTQGVSIANCLTQGGHPIPLVIFRVISWIVSVDLPKKQVGEEMS